MSAGTERGIRVALIGPVPPPHGGMANQTLQLERLLGETGIDVELVPVNPPYRPAWLGRIRGVRALARLLPYALRLLRAANRNDLAHVMASSGWAWHLFAVPAIVVFRLRRRTVVVNYRGGGAPQFLRRSIRWVGPALRRADVVAVPSPFLARVFAEYGIETEVIPNILDERRFHPPTSPRHGQRTSAEGPRLLVARHLEPVYDIGTAIRALALLRRRHASARLTIAGSGPERAPLERLAADLGLGDAVRFTGTLENERIAALYEEADLVWNTSLIDNMPISILEALACGVPVVSTNVGGVPDLVEDGRTAALVPPRSPEALCDATARLWSDSERRARQVDAGLALAHRFTWNAVRPRLLACYAQAAARR